MNYSIDIINQIAEGSYQYEIDGINAICVNLGGVGGHTYTIDALNELCTLQGVASGHSYNIDALNAICSGAYTDEYSAWVDVGTLLNQYPAVLDDGNTVAWYDYTAADTITKDGSNFVSQWNSRIGSNHLLQAVGTNQPLLTADGVLFDGVDNFMKTAAFVLNQPEFVYMVVNQKTWTYADKFIDGIIQDQMLIYQRTSSQFIQAYAGELSTAVNAGSLNTYIIIRALFNGANSKLQINNSTATTGDFGTLNAGGITLGAGGDVAYSDFINAEFKEVIIRKVADNSTDETAIYNYLKNKYGL